jgi:hypothetical protein
LIYSQIFLVTSVRGIGAAPITAAKSALMVMGFMKAALGARLTAGAFLAVAIVGMSFSDVLKREPSF